MIGGGDATLAIGAFTGVGALSGLVFMRHASIPLPARLAATSVFAFGGSLLAFQSLRQSMASSVYGLLPDETKARLTTAQQFYHKSILDRLATGWLTAEHYATELLTKYL